MYYAGLKIHVVHNSLEEHKFQICETISKYLIVKVWWTELHSE